MYLVDLKAFVLNFIYVFSESSNAKSDICLTKISRVDMISYKIVQLYLFGLKTFFIAHLVYVL